MTSHDDAACTRLAARLFPGVVASTRSLDRRSVVPWTCPHGVLFWLADADADGPGYTWSQHMARR